MKKILRIMILLVASVLVIQTAYASSYQKIDLGTLGGYSSYALGINNAGQIVGYNETKSGVVHTFLWENGVTTDLGTLGGDKSWAYGINDKGQIVGYSRTKSGVDHAFLWKNGVMTDLGTLGGDKSWAYGINDKGQIIGYSQTKLDIMHAFLWENGVMTDLETLGGDYSIATEINNTGQIVGYSQTRSGVDHAFLWENDVMTDLGTLGGDKSWAYGINDKGQIVGYSRTKSGVDHAFLWENGVMTDLGTLGGDKSWAYGINNKGQIVGYSSIISIGYPSSTHATSWSAPPLITTCYVNGTNYQRSEWGQYPVITKSEIFGVSEYIEQEVPLFSDRDPIWMSHIDKLVEIVLDSDDIRTLKNGEKLDLGHGYALKVKQVDVEGEKVWLEFTKDGEFVDDQIISTDTGDNTWTCEVDNIQGEDNVPVLKIHVNQVFQCTVGGFVKVDGLWLIDYVNTTTLSVGNQIGDYQLKTIYSGTGPNDLGYLTFEFNSVN